MHIDGDLDVMNVMKDIFVVGDDDGGTRRIVVRSGSQASLRCPEGDVTMVVDRDEADETYLCPKHAVPLERSGGHGAHRILIETKEDDTD